MDDRAHVRQPEHLDHVAVGERLGRDDVLAHGPVEADADDVALTHPAAVVARHPRDRAARDRHEPEVGVAGRLGEGDVERHPVEPDPERVGHHRGRLGEDLRLAAHGLGESRGVGRLREAHRPLGLRALVRRAVHRLGDPDLVDALARAAEHHAHEVRHARVGAAAEDRGAGALAGLEDPGPIGRGLLAAGDPGRAGADVHPGTEQRAELVDARPQRVVAARVRAQGEQRLDVVGREHPGRLGPAAQVGGIRADLLLAVGVHAHQLEVGAGQDRVQRTAPDVAGRPLDHPERSGRVRLRHDPHTRTCSITGPPERHVKVA